jgi:hypothetical protein
VARGGSRPRGRPVPGVSWSLDRAVVRERRAPRGGVCGGDRLVPGPGAVDADNVRSELRKHHATGSGRRRSSRTRRCAVPRAVGHPFHSPSSRSAASRSRPVLMTHPRRRSTVNISRNGSGDEKPREQHTWQPARQRPRYVPGRIEHRVRLAGRARCSRVPRPRVPGQPFPTGCVYSHPRAGSRG